MENNIGENIRTARLSKGYTQKQLADKLGEKHASKISNWEKGLNEPKKLETIIRLAEILETTTDFLIKGTTELQDSPPPPYTKEDPEIKALEKERRDLIEINKRLSEMLAKLQNAESRSDEEKRELQRKYEDALIQLAKIKSGEDID